MKRLKWFYDNFEILLMIVFLDGFMLNVLLQIITRVFFNQPLSFTEELSRYLFIWMVFLGLPYSTKYDKHISLDFFVRRFPKSVQFFLKMIVHVITLLVFVWVLRHGISYLIFSKNVKTSVLQVSKALVAAILPLTAALMILRTMEKMISDIRTAFDRTGEEAPE